MSDALIKSQTQGEWCYRALTAEARMEQLECMRAESLAALRTLERWFDTDQEIIDNMSQDEASNHKKLHNMLKATIAKVSQ